MAQCTGSATERGHFECRWSSLDLATATFLLCFWFCRSLSLSEISFSTSLSSHERGKWLSFYHPQSRLCARLDDTTTRGGEENPQNLAPSMNKTTLAHLHCPLTLSGDESDPRTRQREQREEGREGVGALPSHPLLPVKMREKSEKANTSTSPLAVATLTNSHLSPHQTVV